MTGVHANVASGIAVCILGMSRTGTSLTARLLNLAGVYLGPEEELLQKDLHQLAGEGESVLTRARETNPEGFWEHYRIMRLNERILRALGGNWREPPELEPGWERSEKLAAERDEARALLEESFAGQPLWGWKDPRNSLTLPFWQQLLPEMRYVICLRNPIDVAASLEKRDRIPFEQAVGLWLTYVARALVNTAGKPRLLVPYESHFDDAPATAARLSTFVGRKGAFDDPVIGRQLDEAIDERLWRHRTLSHEVARQPRVPSEAVSLHQLSELLATPPPSGPERRQGDASLALAVDVYAQRLLDGFRGFSRPLSARS